MLSCNGSLNLNLFFYIKQKNKGTEGICYSARRRSDNKLFALKRARVYPQVSSSFLPFLMNF